MKTIWKYDLELVDRQTLKLPSGAQILTVQMQGDTPRLWALVDPERELAERRISIYGTGNPVPTDQQADGYISTFQLYDGGLIFHVFKTP